MLYFKYAAMNLRSAAQYRASMWMMTIGQFAVSFLGFVGIYLLFDRFGTLAGWTLGEVALCFAIINTAFSLTECYARGFDRFHNMVSNGGFDRVLLRPRGTILQVLGSDFDVTRLGKLLQSAAVLALAITWLGATWTAAKIVTLVLMITGGVFIFTGIFILSATVCFFTVQGLEFLNIFTFGADELAAYPLTIYNKWVRRFFTFIIPFGTINYLPLMYLTGRAPGGALYMLTPLLGMLFLLPCVLVWRWGVRRYLSTGN
jgi:ABC-2 type transport system permease protein